MIDEYTGVLARGMGGVDTDWADSSQAEVTFGARVGGGSIGDKCHVAVGRIAAAESSPIAVAVRRRGDDYPQGVRQCRFGLWVFF